MWRLLRGEQTNGSAETSRSVRLFVRPGRMSPGHDAAQMLLKAQVRFAGESVRVRLDRAKKAFDFPLDLIFRLNLMLPCGVGWC
jgi:hypothetical protein